MFTLFTDQCCSFFLQPLNTMRHSKWGRFRTLPEHLLVQNNLPQSIKCTKKVMSNHCCVRYSDVTISSWLDTNPISKPWHAFLAQSAFLKELQKFSACCTILLCSQNLTVLCKVFDLPRCSSGKYWNSRMGLCSQTENRISM